MNTSATDRTTLLSAIQAERRVELFSEWGHRFFDLKRGGNLNQVMSLLKTGWKETSVLLPIPQYERLNNPNLTQKPGLLNNQFSNIKFIKNEKDCLSYIAMLVLNAARCQLVKELKIGDTLPALRVTYLSGGNVKECPLGKFL